MTKLFRVALWFVLLATSTAFAQNSAFTPFRTVPNGLLFIANPLQTPSDISETRGGNVYGNSGATSPLYIYTYAGGGTSGDGGPATSAFFANQIFVAVDPGGNVYVSDTLFRRVRRIDARTGIIETVAGTGASGFSGDGGLATAATFSSPEGIAFDSTGNLYITDSLDARVRKVDAKTGIITTVAGSGTHGISGDGGVATDAEMVGPFAVVVSANGDLYIQDSDGCEVRKVEAVTGIISTYAGTGGQGYSGDGGPATSAQIQNGYGLALDAKGNLYIADSYNYSVRKVDATSGIISTIAGTGIAGYGGDGGPALNAQFQATFGLAFDAAGNLYVGDSGNNRIRRIDATTGTVTTIAGDGTSGFSGDGGPAATAEIGLPESVALNASGNIFIADELNARIRVLRPESAVATTTSLSVSSAILTFGDSLTLSGTVSTKDGSTPTGKVTFLNANDPTPLGTASLDGSGVASITFMPPAGMYSVTARFDGSAAEQASTSSPAIAVTVMPTSTATVLSASATSLTFGQTLTLTAAVTDASGSPVTSGVVEFKNAGATVGDAVVVNGIASYAHIFPVGSYAFTAVLDGDGNQLTSTSSVVDVLIAYGGVNAPNIYTYAGTGAPGFRGDGGPAKKAEIWAPREEALDAAGNLYFADISTSTVQRVDRATGILTTVAGTGIAGFGGDGGPATSAQLLQPEAVAVDAAGSLYIADYGNNRIRKVDGKTGIISTFAGDQTQGYSGDGGLATDAELYWPVGVGVDTAGNVYIADTYNECIRRVDATSGIITTVAGSPNGNGGLGDGGKATKATLSFPTAVVVNAAGDIFISDSYQFRVRKVDGKTGRISTYAGNGTKGYSGDYGAATSATIAAPLGESLDTAGNLYFDDDFNHVVRRVDASTGVITTVAGIGTSGFSGDGGPANHAQLNGPAGVAVDATGNIFISDTGNSRIRIVGTPPQTSLVGTTTTLIASGNSLTVGQTLTLTATVTPASGSPATGTVTFYNGTASLGSGSLLNGTATLSLQPAAGAYSITANYGGSAVDSGSISSPVSVSVSTAVSATTTTIKASPTSLVEGQSLTLTATVTAATGGVPVGAVNFLTGNGSLGLANLDGSGVATLHLVPAPGTYSITASYSADQFDQGSVSAPVVVVVTGNGTADSPNIYTYAGTGTEGFTGNGGPALKAELWWPSGEAIDSQGNLYFADVVNCAIRKVDAATGILTTLAGDGHVGFQGDGGPATDAEFSSPQGVGIDAAGNLYIPDDLNNRVRKIDAKTGIITTVAGNGIAGFSGDGGLATDAELHFPDWLVSDAAGNLYISDLINNRVRRVDAATGVITTVAGDGDFGFHGDGVLATSTSVWAPYGVGLDKAGNLYIADNGNNRIRKVDKSTGIITTIAGNGTEGAGGDGGLATSARLNQPLGDIRESADGDIYFADENNYRVRCVDGTTGIISTFAGNGVAGFSGDGGPANQAEIYGGGGLVFDAAGHLYIGDTFNDRIRVVGKLVKPGLIATTTTLAVSARQLVPGQSLTLTATVTAASGSSPTGTVTFVNGTQSLGTATLGVRGVAVLSLTLAEGNYSISASYGGSAVDSESASAPVAVTVGAVSTATLLSASATDLFAGQSLTLTAKVIAAKGATPTGTVRFTSGINTQLGIATLNGGVATLTLKPGAGSYSITATYGGSVDDAASISSALQIVVASAATMTELTASPNPAPLGTTVQLLATVGGDVTAPVGSVTFYDGKKLLARVSLQSGSAEYSVNNLSVGTHALTAAYSGGGGFDASVSNTVNEVIESADFKLAAAPGSRTVYTGESAQYIVAVSGLNGFALDVGLSCAGLPAYTTCSFSPGTISGGTGGSVLTVETTAPSKDTKAALDPARRGWGYGVTAIAGILVLLLPRRFRRNAYRWPSLIVALALSLIAGTVLTACGGESSLSGGTPVGKHTITITATAEGGGPMLKHTKDIQLDVKSLF